MALPTVTTDWISAVFTPTDTWPSFSVNDGSGADCRLCETGYVHRAGGYFRARHFLAHNFACRSVPLLLLHSPSFGLKNLKVQGQGGRNCVVAKDGSETAIEMAEKLANFSICHRYSTEVTEPLRPTIFPSRP